MNRWSEGRQQDARRSIDAPWRRRRALVTVLLACTMAAWPGQVSADYWYEHYARAEEALRDGDWTQAVAELQQALERKGDSGARVRTYGMKVVGYFPYLKLGIAYYQLGQIDAALQAFQTEEQLGAIHASSSDFAELERFRNLALAARADAEAAARERVEQIVREGLRAAEMLEQEARYSEAMEALSRGLAVDPRNAQLLSRMEELRSEVVRRDRERADAARADDLVERGRSLLEHNEFSEASSLFRQALEIRPDPDVRQLFDRAQRGLQAEVRSAADARARQQAVAAGVAEAGKLEADGKLALALDRLERVLALDPGNDTALNMQARIIQARLDADLHETIASALGDAAAQADAGRFEKAIAAANRVLALDPGNAEALARIQSAYGQISGRLLGSKVIENIPPAIRFADFRSERPDGTVAQMVDEPEFRLSGVVIDNSPVEITLHGPNGRALETRNTVQPVGEVFITEFTLDDRLTRGPTTYQLRATDIAGLATNAEYTVVYVAPMYREAWFLAAISLIPVAALITIWGYRIRRRSMHVRRRFNPFIAGAPVLDSRMFFGRDQLVERILQTIHNNSLLLHGERRIGKTTIQHQVRRRLLEMEDPEYDFFPVYVDLQGTPESQFFSTLAEEIFRELEDHLEGARPATALHSGTGYGYHELVRDLRLVINTLVRKSSKTVKLVLLIDEVDELNAYDPRINQRLRSLFMKSFAENLVAVVSGVEIRKQWDQEGSPWYNFFEEIEIEPIDPTDAVELITRPIRDIFKIEALAAKRIIELSDRRPYQIQRLCVALVNRMYEQRRSVITCADVDAVANPE